MNEINKAVKNMSPSGIREFFDLVLGMKDVISLGVGEPDFVTPWNICEYSIFALEKGYTSYTSNKGLKELRDEISKYLENKYKLNYHPDEEILITAGVSQAFDLAIRTVVEPEDKVIIPTPSYVSYSPLTQLAGGVPILVPTNPENGFRLTKDQLDKICEKEKNVKIFILNYPTNPTGASYTRKELVGFSKVVKKYNLLVISDEIYDQLSYSFPQTPFSTIPDMKERTIYLNGFSKSYAMTGWRVGFSCGPSEIISAMTKIHQYTMLCAPIMSQMAAIEALRNSETSVRYMVKEYIRRKRFLLEKFNELGLTCNDTQGTFYLYPYTGNFYKNSVKFAKDLVKKHKVAVIPGLAFGPQGDKFIRVSYASDLLKLKEASERIKKFLTNISD